MNRDETKRSEETKETGGRRRALRSLIWLRQSAANLPSRSSGGTADQAPQHNGELRGLPSARDRDQSDEARTPEF